MHTLKIFTIGALVALAAGAPAAAPAPITDFGWMSGRWCLHAGDELVEEFWMPARGDLMLGLSRTVQGGKTTSFEYLRIEQSGTSATYLAQPQGGPPTAFKITATGADWVRFENPAHDFPRRVEYRRTTRGVHAEIAGPGRDGKETVIPFDYQACRP